MLTKQQHTAPRLYKLLQLVPDRCIVNIVTELVRNCSFTLITDTGFKNRLRRQKMVFLRVQYWHLPSSISTLTIIFLPLPAKKFACADRLSSDYAFHEELMALKKPLSQDMAALSTYFKNWKLKLKTTNTLSISFYLNNKEANCELNATVEFEPSHNAPYQHILM